MKISSAPHQTVHEVLPHTAFRHSYMKELVDKHIALGHVIDDEKDGR